MNTKERSVFQKAIAETTDLFKRRTQAEDWSRNLIEGSSELKTAQQWKHFYTWLANPNQYNEEETNKMEISDETAKIEPYDSCMRTETFQNGPCETIINIINTSGPSSEQDEEKTSL